MYSRLYSCLFFCVLITQPIGAMDIFKDDYSSRDRSMAYDILKEAVTCLVKQPTDIYVTKPYSSGRDVPENILYHYRLYGLWTNFLNSPTASFLILLIPYDIASILENVLTDGENASQLSNKNLDSFLQQWQMKDMFKRSLTIKQGAPHLFQFTSFVRTDYIDYPSIPKNKIIYLGFSETKPVWYKPKDNSESEKYYKFGSDDY